MTYKYFKNKILEMSKEYTSILPNNEKYILLLIDHSYTLINIDKLDVKEFDFHSFKDIVGANFYWTIILSIKYSEYIKYSVFITLDYNNVNKKSYFIKELDPKFKELDLIRNKIKKFTTTKPYVNISNNPVLRKINKLLSRL